MKILVTGATGFLGYHFAKEAVKEGHDVLCLRRSTSQSLFEDEIEHKIAWVTDDSSLKKNVACFAPDVLMHAAWGGVRGTGRDNRDIQNENLRMSDRLFSLYPYKQIIALGSQAEYGFYHGPVQEEHDLNPTMEYGVMKNECRKLLEAYCTQHCIEWQWIRIFTVFGEKQKGGLIDAVVRACREKRTEFSTTPGNQVYAYMYAEDFAKSLCQVLGQKGKSGVYNLSQPNECHSNKEIIQLIKEKMNSSIILNFGAIPYPVDQVMLMDGEVSKFEQAFGCIPHTNFEQALNNTINSIEA